MEERISRSSHDHESDNKAHVRVFNDVDDLLDCASKEFSSSPSSRKRSQGEMNEENTIKSLKVHHWENEIITFVSDLHESFEEIEKPIIKKLLLSQPSLRSSPGRRLTLQLYERY